MQALAGLCGVVLALVVLQPLTQAGNAQTAADAWRAYSLGLLGEEASPPSTSSNGRIHRLRNLRITKGYGEMYLSNPETFKWAGLAASVSRSFANQIAQSAHKSNSSTRLLGKVAQTAGWIDESIDAESLSYLMGHVLGSGNFYVYEDLYWHHLLYRQCGIGALARADLDPRLAGAWSQIDSGRRASDPQQVWDGNEALLRYEQEQTLQRTVFGAYRDLWREVSGVDRGLPIPLLTGPYGPPFRSIQPDGDFGEFAHRWKWVVAAILRPVAEFELKGRSDANGATDMTPEVRRVLGEVDMALAGLEVREPSLRVATLTRPACPGITTSVETGTSEMTPIVRMTCRSGSAFPRCGATRTVGDHTVGSTWDRAYIASEDAVEVHIRPGASGQGFFGWQWDALPPPPAGVQRVMRVRIKVVSPVDWGDWEDKFMIVGDLSNDWSNRIIATMSMHEGKPRLKVDGNFSGQSASGFLTPGSYTSVQIVAAPTGASTYNLKFYTDGALQATSPSFITSSSSWRDFNIGYYGQYTNGGHVRVRFKDVEFDDAYDPNYHAGQVSRPTPSAPTIVR